MIPFFEDEYSTANAKHKNYKMSTTLKAVGSFLDHCYYCNYCNIIHYRFQNDSSTYSNRAACDLRLKELYEIVPLEYLVCEEEYEISKHTF